MTVENNNNRPPYWLGLFGLIPGIGAVMGLAVFVLGIVPYKNWKLIVIGIADILLTIAAILVLVFHLEGRLEDRVFPRTRAEIARRDLNAIARQLEFYRFEKGRYPDDLRELNRSDHQIPLFDATQESMFNFPTYRYQDLGEHYRLFSVGHDGIPDTNDDIYPVIPADSGSMHYGWIK